MKARLPWGSAEALPIFLRYISPRSAISNICLIPQHMGAHRSPRTRYMEHTPCAHVWQRRTEYEHGSALSSEACSLISQSVKPDTFFAPIQITHSSIAVISNGFRDWLAYCYPLIKRALNHPCFSSRLHKALIIRLSGGSE